MQVTIEVPDDIAEQMRQANGQDVARHILEAYALRVYQTGEIGGGQLRRLLGFETRDEVDRFLEDHNATHNYTLADLEQDRETARQLGLYCWSYLTTPLSATLFSWIVSISCLSSFPA